MSLIETKQKISYMLYAHVTLPTLSHDLAIHGNSTVQHNTEMMYTLFYLVLD